MGTAGLAWLISEALTISKTYRETRHSSQEAITSYFLLGRSSSHQLEVIIQNLLNEIKLPYEVRFRDTLQMRLI